jgi:hypothetical protein
LLLLAVLLAVNQETPTSEPDTHSETPVPQDTEHPTPAVFETETFYQTIIENNLFRSLGWTPPRPTEPYRLIGTILPTDDRTRPKAILQTTAGNQTYIVMTGETLDASTEVVEIKPKQVVLSTEGQRRTLRLTATHYLNPARVSRRVVSTRRPTPQRPPQGVRRTPTPTRAPTAALSEWQTREGEIIRIGDARLKNPAKWELQRRSRVK